MKKLLAISIIAYLHNFTIAHSSAIALATADSAPAVSVWRGETAYVDIPAAAKAMAGKPAGVNWELGIGNWELGTWERGMVSVTLGYFDEVAYEMQPDGVDVRRRPYVWREVVQ